MRLSKQKLRHLVRETLLAEQPTDTDVEGEPVDGDQVPEEDPEQSVGIHCMITTGWESRLHELYGELNLSDVQIKDVGRTANLQRLSSAVKKMLTGEYSIKYPVVIQDIVDSRQGYKYEVRMLLDEAMPSVQTIHGEWIELLNDVGLPKNCRGLSSLKVIGFNDNNPYTQILNWKKNLFKPLNLDKLIADRTAMTRVEEVTEAFEAFPGDEEEIVTGKLEGYKPAAMEVADYLNSILHVGSNPDLEDLKEAYARIYKLILSDSDMLVTTRLMTGYYAQDTWDPGTIADAPTTAAVGITGLLAAGGLAFGLKKIPGFRAAIPESATVTVGWFNKWFRKVPIIGKARVGMTDVPLPGTPGSTKGTVARRMGWGLATGVGVGTVVLYGLDFMENDLFQAIMHAGDPQLRDNITDVSCKETYLGDPDPMCNNIKRALQNMLTNLMADSVTDGAGRWKFNYTKNMAMNDLFVRLEESDMYDIVGEVKIKRTVTVYNHPFLKDGTEVPIFLSASGPGAGMSLKQLSERMNEAAREHLNRAGLDDPNPEQKECIADKIKELNAESEAAEAERAEVEGMEWGDVTTWSLGAIGTKAADRFGELFGTDLIPSIDEFVFKAYSHCMPSTSEVEEPEEGVEESINRGNYKMNRRSKNSKDVLREMISLILEVDKDNDGFDPPIDSDDNDKDVWHHIGSTFCDPEKGLENAEGCPPPPAAPAPEVSTETETDPAPEKSGGEKKARTTKKPEVDKSKAAMIMNIQRALGMHDEDISAEWTTGTARLWEAWIDQIIRDLPYERVTAAVEEARRVDPNATLSSMKTSMTTDWDSEGKAVAEDLMGIGAVLPVKHYSSILYFIESIKDDLQRGAEADAPRRTTAREIETMRRSQEEDPTEPRFLYYPQTVFPDPTVLAQAHQMSRRFAYDPSHVAGRGNVLSDNQNLDALARVKYFRGASGELEDPEMVPICAPGGPHFEALFVHGEDRGSVSKYTACKILQRITQKIDSENRLGSGFVLYYSPRGVLLAANRRLLNSAWLDDPRLMKDIRNLIKRGSHRVPVRRRRFTIIASAPTIRNVKAR